MSDGTKTREWEGDARPEFPESIDLKITNQCSLRCRFCHEASEPDGKHAPLDRVLELCAGLPRGVEIAIGGGNPLAHPQLVPILRELSCRGLICNLTIHETHLTFAYEQIEQWQARGWVYGVGVSSQRYVANLIPLRNVVLHVVVGVAPLRCATEALPGTKVLALGYKRHGRGKQTFNDDVAREIALWKAGIGQAIHRSRLEGVTLCFDNLALKQLDVRSRIDDDQWVSLYMGDDGYFTMYVDAVTDTFAASSTSCKQPRDGRTTRDLFLEVRRSTTERGAG